MWIIFSIQCKYILMFFISIYENIVFTATVNYQISQVENTLSIFSCGERILWPWSQLFQRQLKTKHHYHIWYELCFNIFWKHRIFSGHGFDLENVLKLWHNFILLDNNVNTTQESKQREVFLFHEATVSPETR